MSIITKPPKWQITATTIGTKTGKPGLVKVFVHASDWKGAKEAAKARIPQVCRVPFSIRDCVMVDSGGRS